MDAYWYVNEKMKINMKTQKKKKKKNNRKENLIWAFL